MKLLASFLKRLYQYSTVCIVIGSPLFFIPRTGFDPDITYYITIMFLVTVATVSYVISALITKSWHTVSKLEFISYFAVSVALLGSVIFAHMPRVALFGDLFNPLSAVSLLSLPVIVYLVRSLPENLRNKLKYVLVIILGVSAFIFVLALMFSGQIIDVTKQLFSGFSNLSSFAVYLGLFAIVSIFFTRKVELPKHYKNAIIVTSMLFLAWALSLSSQDSVRPNLSSTLIVGKNVMLHDGVFGIGAGNFSRAWQLYRPASVVSSPYFGYEFNQGSDTMSTFFVNIGIVGLFAFMFLILSALYSTFVSYKQTKSDAEHFILGLLFISLLYFALISWVVPLSYAMLVVWMVISGLGLAKANLSEYHPNKKLAWLLIPIAILFVANVIIVIQKTRAFNFYTKAQTVSSAKEAIPLLEKTTAIYPYDGFYRTQVENAIQANRALVSSSASTDQEELKKQYLTTSQLAVDAGLAAVNYNSDNYQNYVSLGRAYELAIPFDKEGGYSRAKKAYEEAIKLYTENPYLYVMIARLEASAGTKEGVRTQLTEALQKKQNFADALYLMSQLEASDQKIDEALAYAVEAVKNAPNDPLTYIQAGFLYYGKKDYQNAVTSLKTALEKDPGNANVAYFLALSLRDGGRPDLAKSIAEDLFKSNSGNADIEALVKSLETPSTSTPTTKKTTVKK
ncbi:MAG: tetratricopeptide repeat protein [Candidatus Paceibacterota bacterium]